MELNFAFMEAGKVENTCVIAPENIGQFPDAIYIGDLPVTIGMSYDGEYFMTDGENPSAYLVLPIGLTDNKQIREYYYQNLRIKRDAEHLLPWEDENLTVDEAAAKYQAYFAEGSDKADQLQGLIVAAKEYIRELYPDKERENG